MKDFDDISSTITKYIKGLLTGKELEAFTQQLERDSELREEVEFRKLMIDGIKILGDQRLKKNIERVKRNIKDEESDPDEVHVGRLKIKTLNWNIIPSKKRIVWIAASVLLAILSGFLYANLNYTNQKLAAKNYSFSSVSRGNIENNDIDDLFEKAAEAYRDKNYDQAIKLLSTIPLGPSYNTAQFHLGNLYLESQRSAKAIDIFHSLLETGDKRYIEDAQWSLVIAYLQNNEVEQAKVSLEEILQDSKHSLYQRALKMKKKLNSFWRKVVF